MISPLHPEYASARGSRNLWPTFWLKKLSNPSGIAVGRHVRRQAHPRLPQRARVQAAPPGSPGEAAEGDDRRHEGQAGAADLGDGGRAQASRGGTVIIINWTSKSGYFPLPKCTVRPIWSDSWVGLTLIWLFHHLQGSAWAAGELAELARQVNK